MVLPQGAPPITSMLRTCADVAAFWTLLATIELHVRRRGFRKAWILLLSLSLSLTLSHFFSPHSHSHSHSHSLTLTLTLSITHSLSHFLTLTQFHSHSLSLSLSLTFLSLLSFFVLTLSFNLTFSLTHTLSITPSLSYLHSLSLTLSYCILYCSLSLCLTASLSLFRNLSLLSSLSLPSLYPLCAASHSPRIFWCSGSSRLVATPRQTSINELHLRSRRPFVAPSGFHRDVVGLKFSLKARLRSRRSQLKLHVA